MEELDKAGGMDHLEELEPDPQKGQMSRFSLELKQQVVGQPRALEKLSDSLSRVLAGIQDPERPLLSMLFMGPTGVGKTETVRAMARILFGNQRAFTRVNCQEFSAQFNLSKLLGSPPGYVGGEIKPLLSQENLDLNHNKALDEGAGMVSEPDSILSTLLRGAGSGPVALVLFDEVEKAHPKLWDLLLGILDDGTLVLGNNDEVSFRRAIIILTTNVGSKAMGAHLAGDGIGFSAGTSDEATIRDVEDAAKRAARKVFPFEFLNRFDSLVTFRPLLDEDLIRILDLMIAEFHRRTLMCPRPFLLQVSRKARRYLITHNADPALGARPLRRALDHLVVTPLSHLVVEQKIDPGDLIIIDEARGGLRFLRQHAGNAIQHDGESVGPPVVKWVTAPISGGDDGGEKEDITEEVKKVAAEAAAGGGGKEGASAGGDDEPWVFEAEDVTDPRHGGGD